MNFFPVEREIFKLPKQWLVNVIFTVVGDAFAEFVKERIDDRNQRVIAQRDMLITVDSTIAAAFQNATQVSRKYPDEP